MLAEEGPLSSMLADKAVKVIFVPGITAYRYNKNLLQLKSLANLIGILGSMLAEYKNLRELRADILYINFFVIFPYAIFDNVLGLKTVIHYREHWPTQNHRIQLGIARRIVRRYAHHVTAIYQHAAQHLNATM